MQRALKEVDSSASLHRLVAVKLSKESQTDFLRKFSQLVDETIQISEREELTLAKKDLNNMTALIAINDKGFFD